MLNLEEIHIEAGIKPKNPFWFLKENQNKMDNNQDIAGVMSEEQIRIQKQKELMGL
jgi:hypothetical protein